LGVEIVPVSTVSLQQCGIVDNFMQLILSVWDSAEVERRAAEDCRLQFIVLPTLPYLRLSAAKGVSLRWVFNILLIAKYRVMSS